MRPICFIFTLSICLSVYTVHVNKTQFLLPYFNELLSTDSYDGWWQGEL